MGADDEIADELTRIVRRGAYYLAESLWEFWPGRGEKNEAPERNVTLHVARAFAERGFSCFAEIPSAGKPAEGRTRENLDFMALDRARGYMILAECKRLYGVEKAKEMAKDALRIQNFRPFSRYNDEDDENLRRFGVVLATTWKKEYADWWCTEDATCDLSSAIDGKSPIFNNHCLWTDNIVLQHLYQGDKLNGEETHFLLYSIWRVTA